MSRRLYPHNRVRYWYAYDIDDICALFKDLGSHPQTVRAWIKRGLKTIDNGKPALVYGNDLIVFLKKQNASGKCKTEFNQMFCMKCKDARPIYQNKVAITAKDRLLKVQGKCRNCKTMMFKSYKLSDIPNIRKIFKVVDVLELDDCLNSPSMTHLDAHNKMPPNESCQGVLL